VPTNLIDADGTRPAVRPYEVRLHRLALRAPHGRKAWLPATLLYLVLVAPFLVSRMLAGPRSWFVDLLVYRDAGRQVLDGGHDLYRFASAVVDLPFTYPPFAALLSPWLAWFPPLTDVLIWTVAELAVIGWLTSIAFRPLLDRTGPGRPYLLAALAAGATWLNPVRDVIKFGQVDLFLVALVVADLTTKRTRWPRGLLIGIAAAIKLTPALFVPYLWLTGRRKAAYVATATFVFAELLAQAVIPYGSWDYWSRAITASDRLGSNAGASNQSIRGMLLRLHTNAELTTVLWLGLALVVLVLGMRRAVAVYRSGDELAATVLVGLLSLALSPVSWIHHICWAMLVVGVVADDLRDPVRARWAAYLTVFFVLRLPWYGSTIALHHGVLYPAHLLQDAFGLAVLGLLFWLPTRGSSTLVSAPVLGRGDDAALSGDRSEVVLAAFAATRQEQPAPHPIQPAPEQQETGTPPA
jgi:alpha-1,2-mannosyltransferase